ncbi:uncharacterized protein BJ212DRAFT_1357159 [Suillus subaureus]|uniref:Uncharacterized protein n=1 Tax=Suillus subaureus TaxID=48587 RepID=A0A9P7E9Q8_9AGAM|nr:uncharacterized protein BJ212DRAFT_1357159 [Suillus subaureus]KAG1815534.1 hypothetical protein BJ212DRAFT_1357159 [Suillus subaureus]
MGVFLSTIQSKLSIMTSVELSLLQILPLPLSFKLAMPVLPLSQQQSSSIEKPNIEDHTALYWAMQELGDCRFVASFHFRMFQKRLRITLEMGIVFVARGPCCFSSLY